MKNIANGFVVMSPLNSLWNKAKKIDRTTFYLVDLRMDGIRNYFDVSDIFSRLWNK